TAQDPLGAAGGDPDWYGYCLDDPVNAVDKTGLDADCISIDGNASGFGFRGELGVGVCWDDAGEIRAMGHADGGAGSGWGVGASGTWQTTDAKSVDDLAGKSMVTGAGQAIIPGPGSSKVSVEADNVHSETYNGSALAVGLNLGKPSVTDVHTQMQSTKLWRIPGHE
ncbi:hypothetical protein SAMN02745704_02929, partial [Paucidesulfovibrio gracilis DSM 16080]